MTEIIYYQAIPDADFTSEKSQLMMEGYYDPTSCTAPYGHTLHKYFSERVLLFPSTKTGIRCQRMPDQDSAYPFHFLSNLSLETSQHNTNLSFVYCCGRLYCYKRYSKRHRKNHSN